MDRRQKNDRRRQSRGPVAEERRRGDRRRDKRVAVEMWAEASDGEAVYYNQVADLSAGGVFFDTPCPQPVGTVVQITLELPTSEGIRPVEVRGVVVNDGGAATPGMGVRFLDLDGEAREAILAAVEFFDR